MFIEIGGVHRQVIISMCLYIGQIVNGFGGTWSGPCLPKLRDLQQSPLPYLLTESQLSLIATLPYLGAIADQLHWSFGTLDNQLHPYLRTAFLVYWLEGVSTDCAQSVCNFICLVICYPLFFFSLPLLKTSNEAIVTSRHMTIESPYVNAWLSNTRGRKPCLIAGGVLSVLSLVIMATAKNLAMLYASRFLTGVAIGTINAINVMYIGEIASPKIRGILLTSIGIFTTVGALVVFAAAPYVSYHGTTYIGLALGVIFLLCILWIPETPVYYALRGKDDDLRKLLEYLGRSEEMNQMHATKADLAETSSKREWIEIFSIRSNRKAFFIVVIINILQHCSGVLAVMFFSAKIFELAGSSIEFHIAMIIIIGFQLTGSVMTPVFIEGTGRRKVLIVSTAICALSMFTLGLYFYLDFIENPVIDHVKWLPLVVLILFYVGFDSGFGIIPNALIGEMFTTKVRSKGSTLALSLSYLFGFLVTTAFGALLGVVGGHIVFWFFSCTCACAFLFTIAVIPETKGKTLMEIQEAL